MDAHALIIKPILTEKTNLARTDGNKYYFHVHRKANKIMIKQALAKLFNVTVIKCHMVNVKGKKKRSRYGINFTPAWKKALVTLKAGETFPFYEGV
ncbi:MAG: 50S ribosomal protein L23 [Spirochaetota bacterium]|nr:50S ribosomal protein L23 [Spirochaetota bacterium]